MTRSSREATIRSAIAGLIFTAAGLAAAALMAMPARAAGDGINAQLSNELKQLSATNANVALPPQPKARKKVALPKQAGKKVKLAGKAKSQKVATKVSKKRKGTRVASVGAFVTGAPIKKSLTKKGGNFKGNVSWNAPSGCVPGALKSVLYQVSKKFGPVVVNSSVRGHSHNRRVGGARKSWHLRCMATDFRVHGSTKGLWAFLRSHPNVGGLHRYPSGFYHIDLGPKRTW